LNVRTEVLAEVADLSAATTPSVLSRALRVAGPVELDLAVDGDLTGSWQILASSAFDPRLTGAEVDVTQAFAPTPAGRDQASRRQLVTGRVPARWLFVRFNPLSGHGNLAARAHHAK
jgi:hypothetical protein